MGETGRHAPQGRQSFRLPELFLGVEHGLVESSVLDRGRRLRGECQQQFHLFCPEPTRLHGVHREHADELDARSQRDA